MRIKEVMTTTIGLALMLACLTCPSAAGRCQEPEKMDTLLLNGDDWMFHVREPKGWLGSTEDADQVPANVIFIPEPRTDMVARPLIYIQLTLKRSESMKKALKQDMKDFEGRIPEARFKDVEASHAEYSTSAGEYAVEGDFYEYVAFVNPGKSVRYQMAVVLRVLKREATPSELEAFRSVLASVKWWEGVVPIVPERK